MVDNKIINSNINVIGSIPDYDLIYFRLSESLQIPVNNEKFYKFRTDKTLTRFDNAIRNVFCNFVSEDHKNLCASALSNTSIDVKDKSIVLFMQMLVNNRLFKLISDDVFLKVYYSGRAVIRHDEIVAYLKDLRMKEPEIIKWTESTIDRVASKYLTTLKKFGLLSGAVKKEITHVYYNNFAISYFIYFISIMEYNPDILKNSYIDYSLMSKDAFIDRIKKREYSSLWDISLYGGQVKIELKKTISEFSHVQF